MTGLARIDELKSRIEEAKKSYYSMDPIISDQEYDALVDELKRLDPNCDEVVSFDAEPSNISIWKKVKHVIPMGSLDKVNSEEEFLEWVKTTGTDTFLMTHKIDGSSMELIYKDGILINCVTRGKDGVMGEDVYENISQIPSVPKKLKRNIDLVVRGEVLMLKSVFLDKYAEDYKNPRNTAAAKVREKKNNGADCENLNFLAYWYHTDINEIKTNTMPNMFEALKIFGFNVPEYTWCKYEDIIKTFNIMKTERDGIDYEIDGMVISVCDLQLLEKLGSLNMRPLGQIAWKFDPSMAETTVEDIKWQVGLTGRITGVAVLNPVNIGGVTITNVSLHNLSMFNDLKLFKGCKTLISRRNDVIPYIEKNIDTDMLSGKYLFETPEVCPVCGFKTSVEGQFLFCRSKGCPVQLTGAVKVWVKRLGLLHWGDALIESLTTGEDSIKSVADLYRLDIADIAYHCSGAKVAKKCYETLHNSKDITLELVIASLNIPNLAVATATDIVQHGYDTVDKITDITYEQLLSVPNIGEVTAKQVFDGIQEKRGTILDLASVLNIKTKSGPLIGKSFCITGSTSKPRKALEKSIMDAGGTVKSSVGSELSYLVTNDTDSTSSKMKNAKKYGIKVISEYDLNNMF